MRQLSEALSITPAQELRRDPQLQRQFVEELRKRNLRVLRLSAIIFNSLFVIWSLFDYLVVPALWREFLLLRLIGGALATANALALNMKALRDYTFEAFFLWIVLFGLFIVRMLFRVSASDFVVYLFGYQLVLLAGGFIPFFPLRWTVGCIVAVVGLAIFPLVQKSAALGPVGVRTSILYLTISSGLALFSATFKLRLVERWFLNRVHLREAQRRVRQQAQLASLGQVLAALAHEIGNPLNFATGGVQQLSTALDRLSALPARAEAFPTMLERAERAQELVEDGYRRIRVLVDNLKAQLEDRPRRAVPTGIVAELKAVLALMQPRFDQQGIVVSVEAPNEAVAETEPGALSQVFSNLLVNAFLAMPTGGTLSIKLSSEKGEAIVDIQDSGPGIPEANRARIFEPFFTTRHPGEGTGLGLFVSLRIVERMGGNLVLRDSERGTWFQLRLPIASLPEPS